jgi:hypothetical protein
MYLLAPSPDGMADHLRLRDQAVADFRRADLTAEVALTRGLSAAIHAIATWEDVLEDLEIVRDARALLDDTEESVWLPLLDQLLALVALTAGDLDTAAAAITAVEARRHLHPVFAAVSDVARAEHTLVVSQGAGDAVVDLLAAVDRVRAQHPQMLGLIQLRVAHALADFACTDGARSVGLAGVAWPPTNQMMGVAGALMRVRIGVLDGVTRDADAALVLLDQLVELGHVRRAGAMALRMARDYARVESADAAATLRSWGLDRMPDERRRTGWERRWAEPLDRLPSADEAAAAAAATTSPAPTPADIAVRVLSPVLEISRHAVPLRLRSMPAKLLLALLVTLPEPLHVEQAVELLWPEAAPGVGRPRPNTVVHRLRTALELAPGTLRRVGDVLLLDPAGWDVDLLRFGPPPGRARPRRSPPPWTGSPGPCATCSSPTTTCSSSTATPWTRRSRPPGPGWAPDGRDRRASPADAEAHVVAGAPATEALLVGAGPQAATHAGTGRQGVGHGRVEPRGEDVVDGHEDVDLAGHQVVGVARRAEEQHHLLADGQRERLVDVADELGQQRGQRLAVAEELVDRHLLGHRGEDRLHLGRGLGEQAVDLGVTGEVALHDHRRRADDLGRLAFGHLGEAEPGDVGEGHPSHGVGDCRGSRRC